MTPRARPLAGRAWLAASREHQLLVRAARMDPRAVRRLSEHRLAALVRHAARHNVAWRERLADGRVVVDDVVDLDRFPELPPLGRDEVVTDPWRLTSDDLARRRWYRNRSGGSTGEPVEIVQDRHYLRWARAVKAFFDTLTGYVPGEPKVVLWGAPRDAAFHPPLSTRIRHWGKNEVWLDAYHMEPAAMAEWAHVMDRHRPVQLLGYAESLEVWARFVLDQGVRVRPPGSILSTAGSLSPAMRDTIQSAFGAPVFDRYGSREVGDIACETTRHDGLVVPPMHTYVEVVDGADRPVPDGEEGEIVVTSLTNRAMPLIRYRIGDRGAWAVPGPDRGQVVGTPTDPAWPRLDRVAGRVTDHFVARDGAFVHAGSLRTLLLGVSGIRAFQIVQTSPAAVVVRVEPLGHPSDALDRHVRERLDKPLTTLLRGEVRLTVETVDELPRSPTGKHRHTVSHVVSRRPDGDPSPTSPP